MDVYPQDYVVHNLPLILLSGLGSDSQDAASSLRDAHYPIPDHGVQIYSDFPLVTGPTAEKVITALLSEDASRATWNSRSSGGTNGSAGFRVKRVGRSYTLPPRKALPPSRSPRASRDSVDSTHSGTSPSVSLHSPISPLSPDSPTFPDGMMTPLWVTKHQNLVPAAFVNFFPFSTDSNMASLRDNQLKIEINGLKKDWASSGYKTRFVVALLCEDGPLPADSNERLSSIRRATNLDPKSIFVLPPEPSHLDIADFTRNLLSVLYAPSLEYYRDLSKHARRKRNRGAIPPPTAPPTSGTSQTLSSQGWNIRYDFKLGVLAEFRQEMDAACLCYQSAYASLFGEEVFETIAGWSSRFDDARMLADTLTIRIMRCMLWTEQTSSAVRVWMNHKFRIQDIVGRRGKGTNNYGWEAWEARWSLVMAQVMHQAEVSALMLPDLLGSVPNLHRTIFALPEKSQFLSGKEIEPWENLHHEGYWLDRAAKHTVRRRLLAEDIPDEDRAPPSEPLSAQPASKAHLYDTYLAPEPHSEYPLPGQPGTNHSKLILGFLETSVEEFSKRHQVRMAERQSLGMAKEYMRLGSWNEALNVLRPLWPTLTWRREGWWELMEDFAWTLRECAVQVQDAETVLKVDWELLNHTFSPKPTWPYDLRRSLQGITPRKPKPSVVLRGEDSISCLAASFVFAKQEGNVGEPLHSQLVIESKAHAHSAPISLSEVKIVFEGSLRPVRLVAETEAQPEFSPRCEIVPVTLQDPASTDPSRVQSPTGGLSSMVGNANLSFSPAQRRVFDLESIPREAGDARVASITLIVEEEGFAITYVVTEQHPKQSAWWEAGKQGPIPRRVGKDRDTSIARILPKPPKVRITTPNLRANYYTNERVVLDILVDNEEDQAAELTVEIKLFGHSERSAKISWLDDEEEKSGIRESTESSPVDGSSSAQICRRSIGQLDSGGSHTLSAVFTNTVEPVDYEVEISVSYHLVSDIHTPIFKNLLLEVSFIRPFEANYTFLPRLHPSPWPDFFHPVDSTTDDDTETTETKPEGLQQRWCLNSKLVSFAPEPLVIEDVSVHLVNITGGSVCRIGPEMLKGPAQSQMRLEELRESEFTIEIQRLALDDRRGTALNVALDVRWRRPSPEGEDLTTSDPLSTPSNSTTCTLLIPRFLVPMGEPRVLASATPSPNLPGFIHLTYTLENPSMHFLTFNLNMEGSDQFAFSGPKATALQLVPLSRHTIRYNLLATVRGTWIHPQLLVVDSYFNKTLRVLATEGTRPDKKGIAVWVDAEE